MAEVELIPRVEVINLTYPEIKVFALGGEKDPNFFLVADTPEKRYNAIVTIKPKEGQLGTMEFSINSDQDVPPEILEHMQTNTKEAMYSLSDVVSKNILLMPPPLDKDGNFVIPEGMDGKEIVNDLIASANEQIAKIEAEKQKEPKEVPVEIVEAPEEEKKD